MIGVFVYALMRIGAARSNAEARLALSEARARAGEAAAERLGHDLREARSEAEQSGREVAALGASLESAERHIERMRAEAEVLTDEVRAVSEDREILARQLERIRAEARGFERQIADLKEAKEQMRQSFGETANALLKQHSESFKAQNSEQLDHLLKPLKNDIDAFKTSLGQAYTLSTEQHGSLKQQIEQLSRQSASISKEAENLTRALKGNVQMQGAWGEMIIDTILQRLGLREGVEYTRQESFSDAEGRARTDYILNLPQGERLIIDSKVSLTDFEGYVNAEDDAERAARLAAHARSLRAHVKGLSSKDYHKRVGTKLDFVIMFVPIEAALGVALTHDETLQIDALDQKVAFATPTTLTTQMKTVAAMWRIERQHQNA
ncbi:MAG: DNA recombination protein RmuC, partial [Parvularculaceae bacterium]|nr:DNA recombination protein RmuC [Parvularculaceae bacterium]